MSFPATLSPPYNALHNILTAGGLPEGIAHKILLMIYHVEHRELLDDMKWDIADRAFGNNKPLCEEDPKTATNHFYDCDCCEKHQYNKAVITDVGLMICTKPTIFTAFRYSGRVPPEQWYIDLYGDDGETCHCICRHSGRDCARMWLKQEEGHGREYMLNPSGNPQFTHALGIFGHIHHPPHDNHGPDPDDPDYHAFPHQNNH